MDISYRRSMGSSYMVVNVPDIDESGYEIGMIRNNRIGGLLALKVKSMNGVPLLYYDITGKQSIRQIYRKQGIDSRHLFRILRGVLLALQQCERYMLKWENLVWEEDYIYVDRQEETFSFCYVPSARLQKSEREDKWEKKQEDERENKREDKRQGGGCQSPSDSRYVPLCLVFFGMAA